MEKVGTFNGLVIFHYDFTNKNGMHIKTTKALFSINGTAIYVVSNKLNDHKIGDKLVSDLAYDGSKWVLL